MNSKSTKLTKPGQKHYCCSKRKFKLSKEVSKGQSAFIAIVYLRQRDSPELNSGQWYHPALPELEALHCTQLTAATLQKPSKCSTEWFGGVFPVLPLPNRAHFHSQCAPELMGLFCFELFLLFTLSPLDATLRPSNIYWVKQHKFEDLAQNSVFKTKQWQHCSVWCEGESRAFHIEVTALTSSQLLTWHCMKEG